MKDLPATLTAYRRTPEFTEHSVPKALLESHSTRPGTWGKIIVLEGSLTYRILEPDTEEIALEPGTPGIIEPAVRHEVEIRGEVRFYVEFYRRPGERTL